jgi:hypothetical protein
VLFCLSNVTWLLKFEGCLRCFHVLVPPGGILKKWYIRIAFGRCGKTQSHGTVGYWRGHHAIYCNQGIVKCSCCNCLLVTVMCSSNKICCELACHCFKTVFFKSTRGLPYPRYTSARKKIGKLKNARQARTGRNMVKSISPNAPSTWLICPRPRTHASPQTCHHSASSVLAVRISCRVIAVFMFREQEEEWRSRWITTMG